MLDTAASTDDALIALQEGHAHQRLVGLRRFATFLADHGALRPGLHVERATDLI